MTTSISIVSSQGPLPIEQKLKGRGNKIVVGKVVKAKIGELEEEVRAGSSIGTRKELNGVVQGVSGRRRLLLRLHCPRKYFSSDAPSRRLYLRHPYPLHQDHSPILSTPPYCQLRPPF